MASEIRVNTFKNRSGLGTITVNDTGANFSGVVTATSGFSGALTGNVTGNVTGNLTGNVTADTITVGDKFISSAGVGVGTTDTAGRNAGVGTATGTLIYNTTTDQLEVYTPGGWQVGASIPFSASSPTVTADTSSRPGWAVFSFTSPGSLVVGSGTNTAEYLVIAGGAAGGGGGGGGGGAGGYRAGTSLSLSPGTYTIQVGSGGASPSTLSPATQPGGAGTPSFITNPGISSITSSGGGGGGKGPNPGGEGDPGGSGGGGGGYSAANVAGGTGNAGAYTPAEGNDGGLGEGTPGVNYCAAGGGGGAGGPGGNGSPYPTRPGNAGDGGNGASSSITGSSVTRAGGGGGAGITQYPTAIISGAGGPGGGGAGATDYYTSGWNSPVTVEAGDPNTGGGGGGGGAVQSAAAGGSGIVIIAYPTS